MRSYAQSWTDKYPILSGNPDTSLAIFLFKEPRLITDFVNNREEYIRWDLEHRKIYHLMTDIFKSDPNFQNVINIQEENRKNWLKYARQVVYQDYRNFHSVYDEMEFEYLLSKKDSVVVPLIRQMVKDKKVADQERKKLSELLKLFWFFDGQTHIPQKHHSTWLG